MLLTTIDVGLAENQYYTTISQPYIALSVYIRSQWLNCHYIVRTLTATVCNPHARPTMLSNPLVII